MQYIKQTISQLLVENAMLYPNKIFIVDGERSYTFSDIYRLCSHESEKFLAQFHLKPGDYVAIYAGNSIDWLIIFFSLQILGVKTVLFNPHLKYDEVKFLLQKNQIDLLFYVSSELNQDTVQIFGEKDHDSLSIFEFHFDPSYIESILDQKDLRLIEAGGDHQDVAVVIFTSGSTGKQKGVLLSHHSVLNNAKSITEILHWNSEDSICVSVPFFHCFGLTTCILASLVVKSNMCIVNDFSTSEICRIVEKNRCTILNGVPTMFLAMARKFRSEEYDLSSLKSGIIAGSPIYENDYLEICKSLPGFLLQPSYGQSETSPCISLCALSDSMEIKSKSVGRAIPDVELRIRDLYSDKLLGADEMGEIETRGYHIMKAYLNDEEETRLILGEDGWLKTGDIGFLDTEFNLHIKGRRKNLIIRAGENISPVMIEKCIKEFDSNFEVVALGIKSDVMQEEIAACIVGGKSDEDIVNELKKYLTNRIPSYAVPKYFLFFDDFNRTSVGKVDLKSLSDKAERLICEDKFCGVNVFGR